MSWWHPRSSRQAWPQNTDSANRKQRFLGEFGGPAIVTAPPYDPQHFVRVDQTVTLTLKNLDPHTGVTVSFDLYVMKSWDGNNPHYGPDRWSLSVEGGNNLLDTKISNNFKTGAYDLSLENYPAPDSLPQAGAASANTLEYNFYGDSIYHLTFTFPHSEDTLILNFSSSMFEGKGTDDENWGSTMYACRPLPGVSQFGRLRRLRPIGKCALGAATVNAIDYLLFW